MSSPRVLDHVIHLSPPGKLPDAIAHFTSLGFTVLPGGTHADGLTANALVVLGSGVYFELIHFMKTPEETGPPGSPERKAREEHWWAGKEPGWIDWALLGLPAETAKEVYNEPRHGGRTREDGERLEWNVTFPKSKYYRGTVPFYCQDLTPRERRVPAQSDPHPNTSKLVSRLIIVVPSDSLSEYAKTYVSILGVQPERESEGQVSFHLDALNDSRGTALVLEAREGITKVDVETVYVEYSDGQELKVI